MRTWPRSLLAMSCGLGKNMGIALINNPSCGEKRTCALLNSLNAGLTLSLLRTIICCFRVLWLSRNCARGKTSNEPAPRNKCDAGWTNCCHVWALQPDHPNLAENRKVGFLG